MLHRANGRISKAGMRKTLIAGTVDSAPVAVDRVMCACCSHRFANAPPGRLQQLNGVSRERDARRVASFLIREAENSIRKPLEQDMDVAGLEHGALDR